MSLLGVVDSRSLCPRGRKQPAYGATMGSGKGGLTAESNSDGGLRHHGGADAVAQRGRQQPEQRQWDLASQSFEIGVVAVTNRCPWRSAVQADQRIVWRLAACRGPIRERIRPGMSPPAWNQSARRLHCTRANRNSASTSRPASGVRAPRRSRKGRRRNAGQEASQECPRRGGPRASMVDVGRPVMMARASSAFDASGLEDCAGSDAWRQNFAARRTTSDRQTTSGCRTPRFWRA